MSHSLVPILQWIKHEVAREAVREAARKVSECLWQAGEDFVTAMRAIAWLLSPSGLVKEVEVALASVFRAAAALSMVALGTGLVLLLATRTRQV